MSELDGFQQLKTAVTGEFYTSLAVHRASSVLLKYVSFEIHGLFLNTLLVKVLQEKGAHTELLAAMASKQLAKILTISWHRTQKSRDWGGGDQSVQTCQFNNVMTPVYYDQVFCNGPWFVSHRFRLLAFVENDRCSNEIESKIVLSFALGSSHGTAGLCARIAMVGTPI